MIAWSFPDRSCINMREILNLLKFKFVCDEMGHPGIRSLCIAAILFALCFTGETTRQTKREEYCSRRCMHFANVIVRLRYRYKYDLFKTMLFRRADREAKKFCPRVKINEKKCTSFKMYLLQGDFKGHTSDSVCKAFQICEMKQKIKPKAEESCRICASLRKKFFTTFSLVGKQLTEMKDQIASSCRNAKEPAMREKCNFVLSKMNLFGSSGITNLKPETCEKIFCSTTAKAAYLFVPKSKGACQLCHKILNITKGAVRGSLNMVDAVLEDVNSICKSKSCYAALEKTRKIFDNLVKRLSFSNLCEVVRVCPGNQDNQMFTNFLKGSMSSAKKDNCQVCGNVASMNIMKSLSEHLSKIHIYTKEACKRNQLSRRCDMVAPFMHFLTIDSASMCEELFCKYGMNRYIQQMAGLIPRNAKSCAICKSVGNIVGDGIKGMNGLVGNILTDVAGICDTLHKSSSSAACHYAVSEARKIFRYSVSKVDTAGICKDLGICAKSPKAVESMEAILGDQEFTQKAAGSCDACKVINKIMNERSTRFKASLKRLTRIITNACQNARMTEKCSIVQPLMDGITKMNVDSVTSDVCNIHICPSFAGFSKYGGMKSKTLCKVCKNVVGIVSSSLGYSEKMADKILAEVDSICSNLRTEAAQKECHFAVKETKLGLAELLKMLQPGSICTDLKICSTEAASFNLFGSDTKINKKKIFGVLGSIYNQFAEMFG